MDVILKLLFKMLINQRLPRKLVEREKYTTVPQTATTTTVVTTPVVTTPKVTISTASKTATAKPACKSGKSAPQMKNITTKAEKAKTAATTGVKTHSFMKVQKNQTKVAAYQLLDAMSVDNYSASPNEAETGVEEDKKQ